MCLQNNMNYSSLAILSRCPQAPVPNLGQYDRQSVPSSSSVSSVPNEGQHDPSRLEASSDPWHGTDLSATAVSSADVYSSFAAQCSTCLPSNLPAAACRGQYVTASSVSPSAGPVSVTSGNVTELTVRGGFVTSNDDDFDDFKTAPSSTSPGVLPSHHGLGIIHSLVWLYQM